MSEEDQEAVRQHAVAALNITQKAQAPSRRTVDEEARKPRNTALIDGVRKYVMDVRELDIDLIDRINPFATAYAILAKSMNEDELETGRASIIAARKIKMTLGGGARTGQPRAANSRGSGGDCPSITSQDAWEKRMAEGVAVPRAHEGRGRQWMTSDDDELLAELGVSLETKAAEARSRAREERVHRGLRGHRERFVEGARPARRSMARSAIFSSGSMPCASIGLREQPEFRALLAPLDEFGLLAGRMSPQPPWTTTGQTTTRCWPNWASSRCAPTDSPNLRTSHHARKSARRKRSPNRAAMQGFRRVQAAVRSGAERRSKRACARRAISKPTKAEIKPGEFFILGGQKAYVAEIGEEF